MKKNLLIVALALAAIGGGKVYAQDLTNHTYYNFADTKWTDADGYDNEVLFGAFNKVSANGQYAVGYDDQIMYTTFMWDKSNPGTITLVNTDYNRKIFLHDVANDGTAVGSYESSMTNGMRPAYMQEGEFSVLPIPDDFSESYSQGGMGIDNARAITPDGKYIVGHVYISLGEVESPVGGTIERVQLLPVRWTLNGFMYSLTDEYRDLGAAGQSMLFNEETGQFETVEGEVEYTTFFVWDISNDGNTIAGVNTSATGGQNPAFIRDGKLMQLFDCANDNTYTFNGGICSSIDGNGNIYGYFQDDDMNTKYFVYTADGKLEYVSTQLTCGDINGNRYSQSTGSLPYTLDCSEDGKVIVGGSMVAMGFGTANAPALLVDVTPSGVDRIDAIRGTVDIDYTGGMLYVNGEYTRADIYSAQGSLIDTGGQGKAFNLGSQPAGAYIVKVTTADGTKTFKVAR